MARTMPTKKRAADSDNEPEVAPKVSKKVKSTATSVEADGKDDDGNPFWELSKMRRVGVSEFRAKSYINIREYYEKDGKTLPGKKGISLSLEQYNTLLKVIPRINATLRSRGLVVEDGDAEEEAGTALLPLPKTKKERKKSSKANIETTSEEEED
ncbi:hypothetical protein F66182_8862 [Fusarium sp. NRRL 66182]|nr:hypothetical protein F66182_8862 [Fusarium sp. NRRL 66182]